MQTQQSVDKITISLPETPQELRLWLVDKITQLAECFGQEMTAPRLRAYAEALADLSREELKTALNRAVKELKFFPKVAELRELAGARHTQQQRDEIEAQEAFNLVIRHLEREGVMAGIKSLPAPVQFAVRQVGGLFQFNQRLQVHYGDDDHPGQVRDQGFQFLQRDFLAAYKSFSLRSEMLPELADKGLTALPPSVRKFLHAAPAQSGETTPKGAVEPFKAMPSIREPLTDAQLRDRREMLRQQKDRLQSKAEERVTRPAAGLGEADCRTLSPGA